MILLHGTTRQRAERIIQQGPDPSFQEPGGRDVSEEFSMNLEIGPFLFGSVEAYARGKAWQFPTEGGPAVLAVDIPESIVRLAESEWFPIDQGLVQFDLGAGLEELLAAWPDLVKTIRNVP